MSSKEIFRLVAERYKDESDDFALSLGHYAKPYPAKPIGIYNLPEFCGYLRLEMREIRALATD